MSFTQLIEVQSNNEPALRDHIQQWHAKQYGQAPGYQCARLFSDRDRPDRYVIAVDFSSLEAAEENNARPETANWAARLRDLASADPLFQNLAEVYTTAD